MKNLEYGWVSFEDLKQKGCVTLIHGGAGPVSSEMELSSAAQKICLAILQRLKVNGRVANPFPRWPDKQEISHQIAQLFNSSPAKSLAAAQVFEAVWALEASPFFNSGIGSALQEDGVCRVTCGFMESKRRRLSAVINAQHLCHPSVLALALQGATHGVRDAQGAELLARELGLPVEDLVTELQLNNWYQKRLRVLLNRDPGPEGTGTVGAVSCDLEGNLAALTSTGGIGFEAAGRVGDVPTVAGTYCSRRTAVSCTGYGEDIVSHAVAARLSVRLEDSADPVFALEETVQDALAEGLRFAFICVHRKDSGVLWARGATTATFVWGGHHADEIVFRT